MDPTLEDVMKVLYESEINFTIASFWDGGIEAKIGDEMNGFSVTRNFLSGSFEKIPGWLYQQAIRQFPESNLSRRSALEVCLYCLQLETGHHGEKICLKCNQKGEIV